MQILEHKDLDSLIPMKDAVEMIDLGAFPGDASDLERGFQGGWGQNLDIFERELRTTLRS